jgi:hypothetical protein
MSGDFAPKHENNHELATTKNPFSAPSVPPTMHETMPRSISSTNRVDEWIHSLLSWVRLSEKDVFELCQKLKDILVMIFFYNTFSDTITCIPSFFS